MVPNGALCDRCRPIFNTTIEWIRWPTSYAETRGSWHSDFASLQDSAKSGCRLCADVWHEVVHEEWPKPQIWSSMIKPLEYTVVIGYRHSIEEDFVHPSNLPSALHIQFLAQMKPAVNENLSINKNMPESNKPMGGIEVKDSHGDLCEIDYTNESAEMVSIPKRSIGFGAHYFRRHDQTHDVPTENKNDSVGMPSTSDLFDGKTVARSMFKRPYHVWQNER